MNPRPGTRVTPPPDAWVRLSDFLSRARPLESKPRCVRTPRASRSDDPEGGDCDGGARPVDAPEELPDPGALAASTRAVARFVPAPRDTRAAALSDSDTPSHVIGRPSSGSGL